MNKGFLAIVVAFLVLSCGEGNIRVEVDPQIQYEKDSLKILEFLEEKGYSEDQIGSTITGVRYVILDSGSMEKIDESDLVEFDYTGITLGDTIFDTSIKEVGDSLKAYYEENPYVVDGDTLSVFTGTTYNPLFITYSASGWTIPTGQGGYITGFAQGISATFKHISVGGKALILIPSRLAYGTAGSGVFIGPNTVITFVLEPVEVTKQ
ncbi:FKBP-type peptidyl-prolyl cis-trans isomerase [Ekhidna sp.]|uniref:FKBP-type peptidyl-prolyl cis-trans isomerase n=1 Tax=Ekhidna sp. TaxID=2608089 RepID=UPI003516516A